MFYLGVSDPRNKYEKIPLLRGDTNLKVCDTKTLMIRITREIDEVNEINDSWYEDNAEKLMPHIELDLHIVTVDGIDFFEKSTMFFWVGY